MTDKLRLVTLERGRSKDVIRMDVGHHHVLDGKLSRFPNGCAQTLPVGQTSAWIDDRYCLTTNDETDVGDGVIVLWGHIFIHAAPDVNPRCDFVGDKRARLDRGFLRECSDAANARTSE